MIILSLGGEKIGFEPANDVIIPSMKSERHIGPKPRIDGGGGGVKEAM